MCCEGSEMLLLSPTEAIILDKIWRLTANATSPNHIANPPCAILEPKLQALAKNATALHSLELC
jgi:hypothetical protein